MEFVDALIGVVLGFLLAEGSRWISHRRRIRILKLALKNECRSLILQFQDYVDILQKTRSSLSSYRILPGAHVRPISTVYDSSIVELAAHLTTLERNALHVAYDTAKVTIEVLQGYEDRLYEAIQGRYLEDPWASYQGIMEDLIAACERAAGVLKSYLDGRPIDVLGLAVASEH